MTTYNTYSELFSSDNFTTIDNYPLEPLQYKLQREADAINFVGINYQPEQDAYVVSVPSHKYNKQYNRQEPEQDIVKCIMQYDTLIDKYNLQITPYVRDGVRLFTNKKSRWFDTNAKAYILKYHNTIKQADLGKLLRIPVKEVNKYITSLHPDSIKPTNDTVVVVWDVRDRYEQTLNNIKQATVSDADIDLLLGL